MHKNDVVVIGAGMAGLTAAADLAAAGLDVVVLEKSRGCGGRMATRRGPGWQFDHGAQYFTARSAPFISQVEQWRQQGLVRAWQARTAIWKDGELALSPDNRTRYVGVPTMNAMLKSLADRLPLHYQTRVDAIHQSSDGWYVEAADQRWRCRWLIATLPLPQSEALLPGLVNASSENRLAPTWAVAMQTPTVAEVDAIFLDDPQVSWLACDSSKPERSAPSGQAYWMMHFNGEFSAGYDQKDSAQVAAIARHKLATISGVAQEKINVVFSHRWSYARAENAAPEASPAPILRDKAVFCGDWSAGGRVEGAFVAGKDAASRVLAAWCG